VHLDLRHIGDPQWLVRVKIALLDDAVLQRNLVAQRRA
jgi:hypothetical protein